MAPGTFPSVALHTITIRFGDRAYTAISRAAEALGISVSQFVREAALIRAVLDELDYSAEEAIHTAHDLLGVAREVRRLAEVDLPGPQRTKSDTRASAARRSTGRSAAGLRTVRRSAREASQEGKRRLEATRAASRASVWPEPLGTPESVGGRASPSNGSTSI
jgi:uncharacterized protein (DUF1778 family)